MSRRGTPDLVFKVGSETVYRKSYPYQSEDIPRRGDSVRLPEERRKTRMVQRVVYVYGKFGLLRIEVILTPGTRKIR